MDILISIKKTHIRKISFFLAVLLILSIILPVYANSVPTPSMPTNLQASASSTTSIDLTWKMYGSCDGFVIIYISDTSGYYITVSGSTTIDDVTTDHSFSFVDLMPDTTYQISIFAYNDDPTAPEEPLTLSNIRASDTTPKIYEKTFSQIPDPPTDLTGTVISLEAVKITWQDNSNNEAGFKVERRQGSGSWQEAAIRPQDWPQWTDTGLTAGTEYSYRVYAYNSKGNSDYSNEFSITITPESDLIPLHKIY